MFSWKILQPFTQGVKQKLQLKASLEDIGHQYQMHIYKYEILSPIMYNDRRALLAKYKR